jgi:hypothetical protein
LLSSRLKYNYIEKLTKDIFIERNIREGKQLRERERDNFEKSNILFTTFNS